MIHQVTIKNFKSLQHVTVDLKPLTIIIGPNASGKSNFLDSLEAIKRLLQFKGSTKPGYEGEVATIPMDETLWRKSEPTAEMSWALKYQLDPHELPAHQLSLFEDKTDYENFVYNLAIKNDILDEEELPVITQEKLMAFPDQHEIFSRLDDNISIQHTLQLNISLTDLALHFYASKSLPVAQGLRSYIREWRFYKITPHLMRQPTSHQQGRAVHLTKDGRHLANMLHYLSENQPEDFEYIQHEMATTLGFSHLYTKEDHENLDVLGKRGRVYLEAKEAVFADAKPFGPDNLSDGTLGFLALLTVLSNSNLAPLICLEEPERSIHLQLIPRLAYHLQEAAQHTQLIVTTHSPEFLDHFDPYEQDYVQVLVAYRNAEGATEFIAVNNIHNVQKWLDDYMLGQIWSMGQLEELRDDDNNISRLATG